MIQSGILKELRRIVGRGYVLHRKEDLIIYSNDATMFDHWPDVVVQPASRNEVISIVNVAARNNIPITGRGAGTSLSGGPIPLKGGIVVDMARMNRILRFDPINKIAVVEPGVTNNELATEAARVGLLYPPDPSSGKESTMGGNIAECAGGPHGVKYGITRNFVLGLEVVLPDGGVVETGNAVDGDMCGPDWTMLFTGSEGTLGLITAITLRLVHPPVAMKTMVAYYEHLEDAAKTVGVIMANGIIPTTLEIMNDQILAAAEKYLNVGLPLNVGGLLLIEVDGMLSTVEENIERVSDICKESGAFEVKIAQTADEVDALWKARRSVGAIFGQVAPSKFSEDSTVPRSRVLELVKRILAIQKSCDLPVFICGHAGDGNMHPTILFDKRDKDAAFRAEKALDDLHYLTLELGGTLSGEHGIGLTKAPYLKAETGEVGYKLGQDIKLVIDPLKIMNPGKMFFYEGKLH